MLISGRLDGGAADQPSLTTAAASAGNLLPNLPVHALLRPPAVHRPPPPSCTPSLSHATLISGRLDGGAADQPSLTTASASAGNLLPSLPSTHSSALPPFTTLPLLPTRPPTPRLPPPSCASDHPPPSPFLPARHSMSSHRRRGLPRRRLPWRRLSRRHLPRRRHPRRRLPRLVFLGSSSSASVFVGVSSSALCEQEGPEMISPADQIIYLKFISGFSG